MMEDPLMLCLLAAALGCILLGIRLTHWQGKQVRRQQRKQRSSEAEARVICSCCFGWLSGLERVCPSCGKRLLYTVSSRPDTSALLHIQQKAHKKVGPAHAERTPLNLK
jgi:hypothetical protein